jgi:hypothetical protein
MSAFFFPSVLCGDALSCWDYTGDRVCVIDGMILIAENCNIRRQISPSATLSVNNPRWLAYVRTLLSTVRGRRLTAYISRHIICYDSTQPKQRTLPCSRALSLVQRKWTLTSRYNCVGGTRWRSWLGHCATSQKVAGSIPNVFIGFFRPHYDPWVGLATNRTRDIFWGAKVARA